MEQEATSGHPRHTGLVVGSLLRNLPSDSDAVWLAIGCLQLLQHTRCARRKHTIIVADVDELPGNVIPEQGGLLSNPGYTVSLPFSVYKTRLYNTLHNSYSVWCVKHHAAFGVITSHM